MTHPKAQEMLLSLLAIIHRDGGHHTGDVGIEQSVNDAYDEIYRLRNIELDVMEGK
ncbi:hypothetical protein UFOVP1138_21 [uncultured Caudovirales phage]|uniref:Uncharacterized protein n=1 Tax=uncultured Caudovirales phage TaxID=2100421 RepID=A0A6J5R018_9CAUD|nr:hypothetical protein UFOVP975_10 [uncultured Caudovirales phage]CAB4186205.1 hypothetical protein UFOVP1138_21 [uncultured Caudovirales phage]CAB4204398.1 hypothetical protein UFOVP1394_18 [uncultured Caudovirales phage]